MTVMYLAIVSKQADTRTGEIFYKFQKYLLPNKAEISNFQKLKLLASITEESSIKYEWSSQWIFLIWIKTRICLRNQNLCWFHFLPSQFRTVMRSRFSTSTPNQSNHIAIKSDNSFIWWEASVSLSTDFTCKQARKRENQLTMTWFTVRSSFLLPPPTPPILHSTFLTVCSFEEATSWHQRDEHEATSH